MSWPLCHCYNIRKRWLQERKDVRVVCYYFNAVFVTAENLSSVNITFPHMHLYDFHLLWQLCRIWTPIRQKNTFRKRLAVEVSDLCQYIKLITRIFLYSPHVRSALHSRLAHRYEFLQVLHLRTKRCLSVSELSHLKGERKYCNWQRSWRWKLSTQR